jgi:hypothetical protein
MSIDGRQSANIILESPWLRLAGLAVGPFGSASVREVPASEHA